MKINFLRFSFMHIASHGVLLLTNIYNVVLHVVLLKISTVHFRGNKWMDNLPKIIYLFYVWNNLFSVFYNLCNKCMYGMCTMPWFLSLLMIHKLLQFKDPLISFLHNVNGWSVAWLLFQWNPLTESVQTKG